MPSFSEKEYIKYPSKLFSSDSWDFSEAPLKLLKEELMEKFGTLSNYAKIHGGIQVLWNKAYHITPLSIGGEILIGKSNIDDKIKIELASCRPIVCNEKFYPFRNDMPDFYVIFPYDLKDQEDNILKKNIKINFIDFCKRYPLAGKYLLEHKKTIKSNVEHKDSEDEWHLYTRVQNHGHLYPRILVPMTADDTYASVTLSDKLLCDNANMFFIELEDKNNIKLYALAAIINSTLFSVLARMKTQPHAGGFHKFNKQFLGPIPFPKDRFESNVDNIVNKLASVGLEIEKMQKEHYNNIGNRCVIEELLRRKWGELDNLVYKLYGLSEDDIALISKKGRNINRVEKLISYE